SLGTGQSLAGRGAGTYYAYVTGDCGTPFEASVTIGAKTIVAITSASADASSVCPGATATLTANGVAGTNAVVKWYTTSGGTGTLLGTGPTLAGRGPGTYFARVTGDCGTPVEANVTVNSSINVGITSITETTNTVCSGNTTILTANGVSGTDVLVTWWTGAGGTGTNLGTGMTLANQGPGTYFARVTGDCGSPVEVSATINTQVAIAISSATAASTSLCTGSTTTLTANGVAGTNAVVTWWTGTGGTGTNLGTGLTLANQGPGTYYARVTIDCGSAVEARVTVSSMVNAAITSVTAIAGSVCPGTTTTLTANGVAGANAVVNWYSTTGGTGTTLGTGLTLNNRGPGTYFARVTANCGSTAEANITITSRVNPVITSATAVAATLCPGTTTTLTANGVAGANAVVNWYATTGGTGATLGTGLTLNNRGPGTYFARVTADCGSPVEASVTVFSMVNTAITSVTATVGSVCPGTTTTLTANGVAGTNAVVNWYAITGGTGTTLGTGMTLNNRGPGTYYARVTGDCGSAVETSATVTSEVALAITSATAASTSLCAGNTTILTANGVTGTNALVIWWTGVGGTGSNLGTGMTLNNRGPGTYYARVTSDCGSAVEASVTVTSKVIVAIASATAEASPICSNATTTLTANSVSGTNAIVTWWTGTGGTGTNLGTGLTLANKGPGTYYARVTGDCGSAVEASVTISSKVNFAITSATALVNPICSNATTTLTANGVAGTNAIVTWWTASGGTGTNLGTGLTLNNRGAGTYYARVTGECGSAVEASVTVTTDIQNPTITCPPNVYAFSDAGKCTASGLNIGTPITVDNCSVESVTNNAPVVFQIGNTLVVWTVTDGSGNKATCTQTVNVAGIVDAFNDEGSVNGSTGGPAVSNILVNDFLNCAVVNPSEVTASFISSTSPNISLNGLSVVAAPGTIGGVYKLTYQICENRNPNKCDQAEVTVTVISTNDPPVVTGKRVSTPENTPITICLRITNLETVSAYTASICVNPGNGTLGVPIIAGNEVCIDYTPAFNFSGTNNFCLELCGNGLPALCDTATVIVNIIKVNRPPVVSDITKTIDENQTLVFSNSDFTSKFTDPDNDNLVKVKITSLPLNGKLNISGTDVTTDQEILFADISKLVFVPEKDYSGEISFTWKGSDSENYSVLPASVYIIITPLSIFIPEGFSPNGDGVNDYFILQGAERYTIDLKVFNRWGNLVYSSKQYLNDWGGLSNAGVLISNQLPVGTYFYIVKFNNGEKEKIGYLTINR
ncbi:MAG: T9SS type B sorting domain-containing protein, partial [Mariniphaga sp.]|nr:T9SS type B sorting domain-containing protein [Mariniphaga sp.]